MIEKEGEIFALQLNLFSESDWSDMVLSSQQKFLLRAKSEHFKVFSHEMTSRKEVKHESEKLEAVLGRKWTFQNIFEPIRYT